MTSHEILSTGFNIFLYVCHCHMNHFQPFIYKAQSFTLYKLDFVFLEEQK